MQMPFFGTDSSMSKPSAIYPHLNASIDTLVTAVQKLSLARRLDGIMQIVRNAARQIARADGATFVLRDVDLCYYADEDAISPLWKGRRFPAATCVSGWAMDHKKQVVITDVFKDPRVPIDAYRVTFVKSMTMTPIRRLDPVGGIGTYWSEHYSPTEQELDALQALADATSIAMENVAMMKAQQERVIELERVNHKLGRLTWLASHDLKEPLRGIQVSTQQIEKHLADGNHQDLQKRIEFIKKSSDLVHRLVDDLIDASRVENHLRSLRQIDSCELVSEVLTLLHSVMDVSGATVTYSKLPHVISDPVLLSRLLQNLISNAIKFRDPTRKPEVVISAEERNNKWVFCVKDNGIVIEKDYFGSIFEYFTRLNSKYEYPGSGIGLAVSRKIIEDFGNTIWVESTVGQGSSFYFTVDKVATT